MKLEALLSLHQTAAARLLVAVAVAGPGPGSGSGSGPAIAMLEGFCFTNVVFTGWCVLM